MKKLLFFFLIILIFNQCTDQKNIKELDDYKVLTQGKLDSLIKLTEEKDLEIDRLINKVKVIENKISLRGEDGDYYRFVPESNGEINVYERLTSGDEKVIDKKRFQDTLDISDNFFVYDHQAEIVQRNNRATETFLTSFKEEKSEYGNDFFVRIITLLNEKSLPLETENYNTDIHILIQPTELGFENKTFVISDFHYVVVKKLEKENDYVKLIFEHGKFPRKMEEIIIRPEKVEFKNK